MILSHFSLSWVLCSCASKSILHALTQWGGADHFNPLQPQPHGYNALYENRGHKTEIFQTEGTELMPSTPRERCSYSCVPAISFWTGKEQVSFCSLKECWEPSPGRCKWLTTSSTGWLKHHSVWCTVSESSHYSVPNVTFTLLKWFWNNLKNLNSTSTAITQWHSESNSNSL